MVNSYKCYTKSELAGLYGVSLDTFMKWIKDDKKLMEQLINTGYSKFQKLFTPVQVGLINGKLGFYNMV